MNQILKQIATGVAGSIATLILVALWGWTSGGGLVDFLGGLSEKRFDEETKKVHLQITEANQKIQEVEGQIPAFYPRGPSSPSTETILMWTFAQTAGIPSRSPDMSLSGPAMLLRTCFENRVERKSTS